MFYDKEKYEIQKTLKRFREQDKIVGKALLKATKKLLTLNNK